MKTDIARDERDALRVEAVEDYEDALIAANSAAIDTPAFLLAMADVRKARAVLRDLYAGTDTDYH